MVYQMVVNTTTVKKKCYSLFSARRPLSAVFHSGIPSISRRRIDFTFVKRQSTVNSLQPNERNKKRKHREISFNSAVDLAVAALTEDYIFLRAFSLSVLRKRDKRSGGCHRLHSVPPQPWHGAASWERLSDPFQRRAGRFTGRRAERSANNKDGQSAAMPRRYLCQVPTGSPSLGRIEEVGYKLRLCVSQCAPMTHVATKKKNEEDFFFFWNTIILISDKFKVYSS